MLALSPGEALAGRRVLLVDNDMRSIFTLARNLRARGLAVTMAADGAKALALMRGGLTVDFVLAEVALPNLDGCEMARQIRSEPRWQDLPVVLVSPVSGKAERDKCVAAGATAHLSKPLDLDGLAALMQQALV